MSEGPLVPPGGPPGDFSVHPPPATEVAGFLNEARLRGLLKELESTQADFAPAARGFNRIGFLSEARRMRPLDPPARGQVRRLRSK